MKRHFISILAIFFVLISILLSTKISNKPAIKTSSSIRERIDSFHFPSTIVIENHTSINLEIYTNLIIYNIFEIDTVKIIFNYMYYEMWENGFKMNGFIKKIPYEKNSYVIFLDRHLTANECEIVLSHELVHLKQMETLDLVETPNKYIIFWKKTPMDLRYVDYFVRPYELEAFQQSYEIRDKILEILTE